MKTSSPVLGLSQHDSESACGQGRASLQPAKSGVVAVEAKTGVREFDVGYRIYAKRQLW